MVHPSDSRWKTAARNVTLKFEHKGNKSTITFERGLDADMSEQLSPHHIEKFFESVGRLQSEAITDLLIDLDRLLDGAGEDARFSEKDSYLGLYAKGGEIVFREVTEVTWSVAFDTDDPVIKDHLGTLIDHARAWAAKSY